MIKVEWPAPGSQHYTGRIPFAGQESGEAPNLNNSHWFAEVNANKSSITLNTGTPAGRELLKQLLEVSDVLIENYRSGVLTRWGLGYEAIAQINPNIIYVSMSSMGHVGRDNTYSGMGPSHQALSGQTFLSGLPDAPPAGWGWSYMDDTGGMYGAMCVLAALHHRNRTGKGQHVDLAQVAVGVMCTGAAVLDNTVNHRPARRPGYPPGNRAHWPGTPLLNNYRGPTVAPHNSYRTAGGGYNDWCVIVCSNDDEWQKLVTVMGDPIWAKDAMFGTVLGRLENQEEMDRNIEGWTVTLDKYDLSSRCQEAGVRAMPVQSAADRVERDPQLEERGNFITLDHPVMGPKVYQNPPIRASESLTTSWSPGPLIGQDNREIYCGLLGLSEEELRERYVDGTLWPKDLPSEAYSYLPELAEVNDARQER